MMRRESRGEKYARLEHFRVGVAKFRVELFAHT